MQVAAGYRCSSPELPDYEYDSDEDIEDSEDVATPGLGVTPSHVVNERAIRFEQQQMGQVAFTPHSKNLLSEMLDEVYIKLQPKPADRDARQSVIISISKFVKQKIPGSSISAFGSFVMDLFTSGSDLDLSLNLADGRGDCSRNDKVHYLRRVAKGLYGLQNCVRPNVQKIETVYRAAVPVVKFVKFVESKAGIECDISVENNDGVLKSRVLGMFSTMDARFRQLCYLVKAWAKKHNVNSSKNGTLNSLSICLLVAFHLQTCSPPILPPFSVFMEGLHLPEVESCLHSVEYRVREYKDRGFGQNNTESVPELFASFFLKLIAVETLWGQGLCSSTYEGKWISKIWPKNHIGCISVEDFADRTQNVARSVSRKEFDLIYLVLRNTVSNLKDPVLDSSEAKDLKAYLFGSIKQRNKGLDVEVMALNVGNWQVDNGWSSSSDKKANPPARRGYEHLANSQLYSEGSWGQKLSAPSFVNRSQARRGPGRPRINAYQKVEEFRRTTKVNPGFGANSLSDNRELHRLYRGQCPLDLRSDPLHDMEQTACYQGPGYKEFGYRKEDFPTNATALGYSGGGYLHQDGNFSTIEAKHGGQFPDNLGVGYPAIEPYQVGRMTSAVRNRSRSHHSTLAPAIPLGPHQCQVTDQYRRGRRGRTHHVPDSDRSIPEYRADGNVQWQSPIFD